MALTCMQLMWNPCRIYVSFSCAERVANIFLVRSSRGEADRLTLHYFPPYKTAPKPLRQPQDKVLTPHRDRGAPHDEQAVAATRHGGRGSSPMNRQRIELVFFKDKLIYRRLFQGIEARVVLLSLDLISSNH